MKHYKLRQSQLSIFNQWQMDSKSTLYNLPGRYKFSLKYEYKDIRDAIFSVAQAHPQLYVRYGLFSEGEVLQYVDEHSLTLEYAEISEKEIEEYSTRFVRPFDLLTEPSVRFAIVKTEAYIYLFQDIYHISFDGASFKIFKHELELALKGEKLKGERLSLEELADKELLYETLEIRNIDKAYFKEQLCKISSSFYPERKHSEQSTNHTKSFFISNSFAKSFCREHKLQLNALLVTTLSIVLSRFSREEATLFGVVHNGRTSHEYFTNIGMFVRTMPLVLKLEDRNIVDEIRQTQVAYNELWKHRSLSLEEIISDYEIDLPMVFAYQKIVDENFSLTLDTVRLAIDPPKQLMFELFETKDSFELRFSYIKEHYESDFIKLFGKAYISCLQNILSSPQLNTSQISIISSEERKALLSLAYGGSLECDTNKTFIDKFLEQRKKQSHKLAVSAENGTLSYEELDAASNTLSKEIISLGAEPNSFVTVLLPRIKEFMISVLAIFKSGAAYVPLYTESPQERIVEIIADSDSKILITTRDLYLAHGTFDIENVIFVDEFDFLTPTAPINKSLSNSLAYMIYTSGSTGKAKGVMIKHRSLSAYLSSWKGESFEIVSTDRVSAYANFCFDASIDDIFESLFVGASLYIIPDSIRHDLGQISSFIRNYMITWAGFPTQFGVELLNSEEQLPLRTIYLGGERLKTLSLRDMNIVNGYGPTEFTVTSTSHKLSPETNLDNIPIGRPMKNTWHYVLDNNKQLLPKGALGELYLSGEQIALGYWNDDMQTKEVFVPNPYSLQNENVKMYATGDLVRWNSSGELEHEGRKDAQVKLRGFRIELSDIESKILSFSGIQQCLVRVVKLVHRQVLCAYYCADNEIDHRKLNDYLSCRLSKYMLPSSYISLDRLPLNPSGKVDYKALPLPNVRIEVATPPRNVMESELHKILHKLLMLDRVCVEANYFDYGLDSIEVMQFTAQIKKILNENVAYSDVYKYKTIANLSSFLSTEEKTTTSTYNIKDYDYAPLHALLQHQKSKCSTSASAPLGNILLTGATGFLGAHLLEKILKRHEGKVFCIVRKTKHVSAEKRLMKLLHHYFADSLDEYFGKRLFVLNCDLTDREAILNLASKITVPIDTIINAAANVNHYAHDMSIANTNISSVRNVIALANSLDARLIHISTHSVSGTSMLKIHPLDETMLYIGQGIDNQYVYSKFIGERLILEAIGEGLEARIMRVGNLTARSLGGVSQINHESNAFLGILAAHHRLACFPQEYMDYTLELSPVDDTAEAILSLSMLSESPYILHPFNNKKTPIGAIIRVMQEAGLNMEIVDAPKFERIYLEAEKDVELSKTLISLSNYRDNHKSKIHISSSNTSTDSLLTSIGYTWRPISDIYLRNLVDELIKLGYFHKPD